MLNGLKICHFIQKTTKKHKEKIFQVPVTGNKKFSLFVYLYTQDRLGLLNLSCDLFPPIHYLYLWCRLLLWAPLEV